VYENKKKIKIEERKKEIKKEEDEIIEMGNMKHSSRLSKRNTLSRE